LDALRALARVNPPVAPAARHPATCCNTASEAAGWLSPRRRRPWPTSSQVELVGSARGLPASGAPRRPPDPEGGLPQAGQPDSPYPATELPEAGCCTRGWRSACGQSGATTSVRGVQLTGAEPPALPTVPPSAMAVPPMPAFDGEGHGLDSLVDAEARLRPVIPGTEITLRLIPDLRWRGAAQQALRHLSGEQGLTRPGRGCRLAPGIRRCVNSG